MGLSDQAEFRRITLSIYKSHVLPTEYILVFIAIDFHIKHPILHFCCIPRYFYKIDHYHHL